MSSCLKLHGVASWWVEKYGSSKGGTQPSQGAGGSSGVSLPSTMSGASTGEHG